MLHQSFRQSSDQRRRLFDDLENKFIITKALPDSFESLNRFTDSLE